MAASSSHPDVLTTETFKPLLKTLVTTPNAFTPAQATLAFEHLASGPGSASEIQTSAFLTALTMSGVDQRPEIVAAAAKVMRRYSVPVELGLKRGHKEAENGLVVDIVGTGGDGHDTFNVSTSAGIVAAGAGAVVCKVSLIRGISGYDRVNVDEDEGRERESCILFSNVVEVSIFCQQTHTPAYV